MVSVLISADSRYPVKRRKIRAAVEAVLREKRVSGGVEISVLVCGTRKARALAAKYLHDNFPHSTLSLPTDEYPALGDIVICYPLAQTEANRDNVLVDTKVCELVSHGVLHLLGEHHNEINSVTQ
jgi:probable rRNA maturation factor